jgi:hypothetical protein
MSFASLTGALLARKGKAAPSKLAAPALGDGEPSLAAARSIASAAETAAETAAEPPRAPLQPRPASRQATQRPPGQPVTDRFGRARVSLRLDPERHQRLKLAAAHARLSIQDILTGALDAYVSSIAPKFAGADCVCLANDTKRVGQGAQPLILDAKPNVTPQPAPSE